ncbi:TlpA family protein disulfide reductase [Undibacterium flavidum]|uniref:TlpA family protein disulfide reductase n=1 Tax=Undibacterium flavidum TaxID=2762297 RepID=A0ABR6YGE4_9BURK|nr:TlpA disulfide reductase family protein [Undibacterium flavidum]MBC3875554.1 TlpA family protein disulfide reductase [Undibacterium flavidum]
MRLFSKSVLRSALAACTLLLSAELFAANSVGQPAPNELGRTLDGKVITLSSYAGKVVVVSFWATWCTYCLKELPILENIQNLGGEDRVQVIAVNTEERDVFRKVARTLKDLKMMLAYDPDETYAKSFGVKGIPHLVIIGRDGKIIQVYRGYGESSLDGIVADLNQAINTPAPSTVSGAK